VGQVALVVEAEAGVDAEVVVVVVVLEAEGSGTSILRSRMGASSTRRAMER
jgi:hypothetical protein